MAEEQDASATTRATYIYGPYLDEVVQMERDLNGDGTIAPDGSETFYYHTDDMYNVVAITDGTGDVVERYAYADFGQPTILTDDTQPHTDADGRPASSIDNPYLFTGRRWDGETGYHWFRTRYYDPTTGRFTTRDTIGTWGDPTNLGNAYTYVGNNPWTLLDPWGMGSILGTARFDTRPMAERLLQGELPPRSSAIAAMAASPAANKIAEVADRYAVPVATGTADLAVSMIPGLGDAKDIQEVITGVNLVTGEKLTARDRAVTVVAAALPVVGGPVVRKAADVIGSGVSRAGDWIAGLVRGADGVTDDAIEAVEGGVKATAEAEASICAKAGGDVGCFVAGTLVHTGVGLLPIDDVEVGDFVWAWDSTTNAWRLAEVERALVHTCEGDVITIVVGEDRIESTGNHPFWVVTGENLSDRPAAQHVGPEESLLTNRGRWVDARNLQVGDCLFPPQRGAEKCYIDYRSPRKADRLQSSRHRAPHLCRWGMRRLGAQQDGWQLLRRRRRWCADERHREHEGGEEEGRSRILETGA